MRAGPRTPQRSERERTGGFVVIAAMVILMWLVETIDIVAGDLDGAGIHPRDVDGLPGIAASPFLHAGFGHLIGNTIPSSSSAPRSPSAGCCAPPPWSGSWSSSAASARG